MNGHPIENMMQTTLENIRNMVDVNTIVGDTVVMGDGTVIIPISKVSFGFVAGGGEYGGGQGQQQSAQAQPVGQAQAGGAYPFAGGTGAGVSICPMAFLVVSEGEVNLLPVQFNNTYERLLERVPDILCQLKEAFRSRPGTPGHGGESRGHTRPFTRRETAGDGDPIPGGAQDPNVRPPKDEL